MALRRIWVLENFGNKLYSDTEFQVDDVLLFGGEIKGVPREVIANRNLSENVRRIPMLNENVRSLNLSNSVAIVLFEGLRQIGF
jgi:tRNA (cytidine/uridine-2'-O-)-methyltransferase